jgi:hypothetical protein
MIEKADLQADLNEAMKRDNERLKKKCEALALITQKIECDTLQL